MRVRVDVGMNLESLVLQFFLIEHLTQSKLLFFDGVVRINLFCLWTELDLFDIMRIRLLQIYSKQFDTFTITELKLHQWLRGFFLIKSCTRVCFENKDCIALFIQKMSELLFLLSHQLMLLESYEVLKIQKIVNEE